MAVAATDVAGVATVSIDADESAAQVGNEKIKVSNSVNSASNCFMSYPLYGFVARFTSANADDLVKVEYKNFAVTDFSSECRFFDSSNCFLRDL